MASVASLFFHISKHWVIRLILTEAHLITIFTLSCNNPITQTDYLSYNLVVLFEAYEHVDNVKIDRNVAARQIQSDCYPHMCLWAVRH